MTQTLRTLKTVFGTGLVVAATAFLLVLMGRVTTGISIVYLCLAITHIGVLAAIAARMDPAERGAAPVWLYTAGFLHTLIALGVAIATAGMQLGKATSGDLVTVLGTILVPMGGAVVPHFFGVLAGQLMEGPQSEQPGHAYEVLVQRLTRQAEEGYQSLGALFTQREALLKQEIDLLEQQVKHWQYSEQALRNMIARVNALTTEVELAGHATIDLRDKLDASATHARTLAPALQETVKVVGDLHQLQASIVDLLSQAIFHRK
ncbi:MAG: hypothetical protein ACJ8GN_03075 [Longimicrobiaceae bacterium]